jgi:4-diphosphocytidyl-2-C-methyl-D-erythritol kinase
METISTQVRAPAKVNLSLRVVGRRADGFHEVETFISPISLYDELEVEKRAEHIAIDCDDPSIPCDDQNLVVRAAAVFFSETGIRGGVFVRLKKNIPHGAGLGGGSSDAASALIALNALFETNLPRADLAKLAESIGSDVPFFLFESAACCRGRGELVRPEKLKESFSLLLIKPKFGVSTQFAYRQWQTSAELPGIDYRPQDYHGRMFMNDLERPVFQKFVFLGRIKMWLLDQPEITVALMSGSGSTVFAVMNEGSMAHSVAERAKKELDPDLWCCPCETI